LKVGLLLEKEKCGVFSDLAHGECADQEESGSGEKKSVNFYKWLITKMLPPKTACQAYGQVEPQKSQINYP
jgi:hypothetical protein